MSEIILDALIRASGLQKKAIAEDLGLTPPAFSNKVHGLRRFTELEVARLGEVLGVNPRIIRRSLPGRRY